MRPIFGLIAKPSKNIAILADFIAITTQNTIDNEIAQFGNEISGDF